MKYLLTQKYGTAIIPIAISKDIDRLKMWNGYCVVSDWTPINLDSLSLVTETIPDPDKGFHRVYRIVQVVDMDA